jgi:alkaline phosphatase D
MPDPFPDSSPTLDRHRRLFSRRRFLGQFLQSALLASGGAIATTLPGRAETQTPKVSKAPSLITAEKMRPQIPYGVASGDIDAQGAVIWSRADRPSRLIVEYANNPAFRNARRIAGPTALEATDFTARLTLEQRALVKLGQGQPVFYRVTFADLKDESWISAPVTGQFRTPPAPGQDIFFAWSGDTAGQGWGINPEWGGMKIYETMRQTKPDFFIHSGDSIYADGPIPAEVKLDDGTLWKNITTLEKSKVAETLREFRGNHIYNRLDENVRRFNAEVPQLVQWDDHEVRNNWFPQQILEDDRYTEKNVAVLAARAKQAFLEYAPMRLNAQDPDRVYRSFNYGPALDIFMLDERSYRGPNNPNRQTEMSAETAFMGSAQIQWIKRQLLSSKATWKVIASDMPIGLVVSDLPVQDRPKTFENFANGDGPALGRELELADLLQFIKQHQISNIIWLTADVHYAAAHYYDPNQAQFQNFDGFWEFVAGPLNSGTFGPNELDNTFGPQVKFNSLPPGTKPNRSPQDGLQFFGTVKIDGASQVLTVTLRDLIGKTLYSLDLPPALG